MKLDQEQNFNLNAIALLSGKDLSVPAEKMYDSLREVVDAKSTNTRLYALERLLRTIRDEIEAAQVNA
jgi:hypothetical protein